MSRHSLLVALVGLVGTGAVPVVVRLLTSTFARPAGRRSGAVAAGTPVLPPAVNGRRSCDCAGRQGDYSRSRAAGLPGGCPRTASSRPAHGGNVLVDRGHGYVL